MSRLEALARWLRHAPWLAADFVAFFLPFRPMDSRPLGRLCARALTVIEPTEPPRLAPGTTPGAATGLVLGIAAILSLATLLGLGASSALEAASGGTSLGSLAIAMLIPVLAGAAIAPAMLAPFASLGGERGIAASLVRSFELGARVGATQIAIDGALVGGIAGSVVALPLGVAVITGGDGLASLVIGLLWLALAPGLASTLLARAFASAAKRPAYDRARAPRVTSGLRTVLGLIALPFAVLGAALGAVALVPSGMRAIDRSEARALSAEAVRVREVDEVVVLDPERGLRVRELPSGVEITTADGGGAGTVLGAEGERRGRTRVLELELDGRPAWGVLLSRRRDHLVLFDADGVRLDDGIGERIARRVGRDGTLALLIALGLTAMLAALWRKDVALARALDAPTLEDDGPPLAGLALRIGRLRLSVPLPPGASPRSLREVGDATLVTATGAIVSLPASAPMLVPADEAIADGSEIAIVARHHATTPPTFRTGALPFPAGGRVVIGDREHAAEMLLTRAARRAALLALPIAALLVVVAGLVLSRSWPA